MKGRALAVIPSLSQSPPVLERLTDELVRAGFTPCVVVTGRTLDGQLDGSAVPHVSPHANPGFGAAVTVGAQSQDWDWLAVVNDDVALDPEALREHLGSVATDDPGERVLCYLDPVPPKPIPGVLRTLAEVSLVGSVLTRMRPRESPGGDPDPHHWFRPFSFALVSRGLWEHLGGFDDRLPYTFEDADFGRRAAAAGARVVFSESSSVRHDRSSTSGRYLDRVLPVAAWSAAGYLQTLGVPPRRARSACAAALLVRLLLIPFSGSRTCKHITGSWRGAVRLWRNQQPSLPAYESI